MVKCWVVKGSEAFRDGYVIGLSAHGTVLVGRPQAMAVQWTSRDAARDFARLFGGRVVRITERKQEAPCAGAGEVKP